MSDDDDACPASVEISSDTISPLTAFCLYMNPRRMFLPFPRSGEGEDKQEKDLSRFCICSFVRT